MFTERVNIAIVGRMNSGKSTLMNLLTQTNTSIVDRTAGTTADTKTCAMEVHGLGKVMLFDTAGSDETGELGDKKRNKVVNVIKESNLLLLVTNPLSEDFSTEEFLIKTAREFDKQVLIICNIFSEGKNLADKMPIAKLYKTLSIKAINQGERPKLIDFILKNYDEDLSKTELLPFVKKDEYYVLNIPMDSETPKGRYLRPQAMVEEYITRNFAYPVSFRMDLAKARSKDSNIEKNRFLEFLNNFKKRPHAIITDSQAMDIMSKWTPKDIMLTTFSIVMINYFSGGRLNLFVDGLKTLNNIKAGDKILIAEACNHSRIDEDIGTVQIPNYIQKHFPNVEIVHSFGKEFIEGNFKLAIHCGGCMITPQKMNARIRDFINLGIPFTNYGLFLSYIQGKDALQKVLEPFNCQI